MAELDRNIDLCTKTALQTFIYDYPWEHTIAAYMLRFPKHAILPVLLDSEIVSDFVDPHMKIRTVTRKCMIDIEAPTMFKKAIGVNHLIFYQTTTIDAQKRSMKIINFNETFKERAVFGDDCEFRALPADPNKTEFIQYGFFRLPKLPLAKTCEKIMCNSYEKHCAEGRSIDLALINESITSGMWKELSASGPDCVLRMKVAFDQTSTTKGSYTKQRISSTKNIVEKEHSLNDVGRTTNLPGASGTHNDSSGSLPRPRFREPSREDQLTFLVELAFGTLFITLLPIAAGLHHPFAISLMTTLVLAFFLSWHLLRHSEMWINFIFLVCGIKQYDYERYRLGTSHITIPSANSDVHLETPSKPPPSQTSKLKVAFAVDMNPTENFDNEENDDDTESSDVEQSPQHLNEEDEDDDIDDEELKEVDDEDFDDSHFLASSPVDDDLGDLSSVKLRDIKVRIPAFIDKLETGMFHFVMEIIFPNGQKKTVERLYTDFVRLRKHFAKTIPQCKVQLIQTYLPKKKNNYIILGMAIDERRAAIQKYIRGLLLDEAIAKLGHRVLIEFLRRPGPLFVSTSISQAAKRRIFGISATANSVATNIQSLRSSVLYSMPWKSCLKECKVSLDKSTGLFTVYAKLIQKEPDTAISIDDIETINVSTNALTPPFGEDKFAFFELVSTTNETFLFSGPKDLVIDWAGEISAFRQNRKQSLGLNHQTKERPRRRTFETLYSSTNEPVLVINRKKILLCPPTDANLKHPCSLAKDLLLSILELFQEYTELKCVITPKILKKIQKFNDDASELQWVDLEMLNSHSEKLSFFLNIYHTLIVHSALDLGLSSSISSAKRTKGLFKAICYDINNYVFSLYDIEQSVLRSKMSKSAMTTFGLMQRFRKNDPRNRWVLQKPDLRINFVINSGTKSTIYNIFVFSHESGLLNAQLDHASTHFLNEQVSIDYGRSIVFLPRICQYYKNDLGGSKRRVLRTLLPYMSSQLEREVKLLIKAERTGSTKLKVRYNNYDWSMRGVFFRGHDVIEECQLRPENKAQLSEENLAYK